MSSFLPNEIDPNIFPIITPINKNKKSNSNLDFQEQQERATQGKQLMWDDAKGNPTKYPKGIFGFVHNGSHVDIHMVSQVKSIEDRLITWSKNVGQGNRNVLYITPIILSIDWETWLKLGCAKKVQGTTRVVSARNTLVAHIINEIKKMKETEENIQKKERFLTGKRKASAKHMIKVGKKTLEDYDQTTWRVKKSTTRATTTKKMMETEENIQKKERFLTGKRKASAKHMIKVGKKTLEDYDQTTWHVKKNTTRATRTASELDCVDVIEYKGSDVEGLWKDPKILTKREQSFSATKSWSDVFKVACDLGARLIVRTKNGQGKWYVKAYECSSSRSGNAATSSELESTLDENQKAKLYPSSRTSWVLYYE